MSLLETVNRMLDEQLGGKEEIDGASPEAIADCVDLSIAHSPVLRGRLNMKRFGFDIPEPIKPRKDGLRYYVADPRSQSWEWFTPEQMKVMRARFLLMRGWYYQHLGGFSHPDQQTIIAWYFEGGVWRPNADSALGKAMGLV